MDNNWFTHLNSIEGWSITIILALGLLCFNLLWRKFDRMSNLWLAGKAEVLTLLMAIKAELIAEIHEQRRDIEALDRRVTYMEATMKVVR